MCPGHSICPLELIEFLTRVLEQHLSSSEVKEVLERCGTSLARLLKKAFRDVEYNRQRTPGDPSRLVWLYCNLRRKSPVNLWSTLTADEVGEKLETDTKFTVFEL